MKRQRSKINMKATAVVIFLFGLIQVRLCSALTGSPSYTVIGPGRESTVNLMCKLEEDPEQDPEEDPKEDPKEDKQKQTIHYWLNKEKSVVAFTAQTSYAEPRMNSSLSQTHMDLVIKPVELSDDGEYVCHFNDLQSTVKLFVNQLPTISIRKETSVVLEGELSKVATCFASLSKPPPVIWFEDSRGREVKSESSIEHIDIGNGLTNSSFSLEKRFYRSDSFANYNCRIEHVNQTERSILSIGKVNVKYPPAVSFTDKEVEQLPQLHPEGRMFEMGCDVLGFPAPNVTWTFSPDVEFYEESDENLPPKKISDALPSNFLISEDGRTITSQGLKLTDAFETNNGTFTCYASNELGTASKSFALQVYEIPVTTQASTTADVATNVLPRKAGADAAVIGGVVAVAVFVLIITIILLLRYFLSHKGEYYTHELKANEEDPASELSDNDEDDGLPRTEADLLGEKKRTEHFL